MSFLFNRFRKKEEPGEEYLKETLKNICRDSPMVPRGGSILDVDDKEMRSYADP